MRAIRPARRKVAHNYREQRLNATPRANPMNDDHANAKTTLPANPGQVEMQSDFERVREAKRSPRRSERDAMFACLQELVLDGLRHGFFDCIISCKLANAGKRHVIIKAGKSHQFTIREEDLRD
jgi:hypothetical protein